MSDSSLSEAMKELLAAEEFLDFFGVAYEPSVVQVNRLHILQRFHDYIEAKCSGLPEDEEAQRAFYRDLLERAYLDFQESDARTEKVFKVFNRQAAQPVFVPVPEIFK